MDKNIILLSGEQDIFIKNKNNHFQNQLLKHNYLDPETSYCISPKVISIDLQFANPACANHPDYPAFIACPLNQIMSMWESLHGHMRIRPVLNDSNIYKWKTIDENGESIDLKNINFPLESFYTVHKYYLNRRKKYKMTELFDEWHDREITYKSLATTTPPIEKEDIIKKDADYVVFGHVENEPVDETVLFFHENFVSSVHSEEFLVLNNADREWVFDGNLKIGDEKYYYYVINIIRSGIKFSISDQSLCYQTPQIIKIICKNVTSIISNNTFSQMIGLLSINPEMHHEQIHHTFKGQEYYLLQHRISDIFEIELLDEKDQKIRIDEGLPTVLELGVKKIMDPDLNIQVKSSDNQFFDNTPTNFKVHLINSLQLTNEYKCALSSITYKNNFKYDSAFKFYFVCYEIGEYEEIISRSKIVVGANSKSTEEILSDFEQKMKVLQNSKNTPLLDANIFNSNGLIFMSFTAQIIVCFSYHLAHILGVMANFTNVEEKSKIVAYHEQAIADLRLANLKQTNGKINEIENPTDVIIKLGNAGYGGRYIGARPIDKQYKIQQEFLFITADFVKPLAIGNGEAKIIKTISIPKNTTDDFVTMNFDNLDFHPLHYYNFQTLGFALVSLTGEQLQVRDESVEEEKKYNETHLSLVFKHFPPN